ncbi:MAG: DUF4411 family protein [Acidobacteria bacterium]|nr:MAG: DUF4411 family protein [Acidobacteriota bacterium]
MVYVFDTSSLRVLGNYYPSRFPTFWRRFEPAVEAGSIRSVREVHRELELQSTKAWLKEWAGKHRALFAQPGPEETAFVAEIFRVPHFQALIGKIQRLKGRPVADPFVVAAAKVMGGIVVTEEADRRNAAKIPNVCHHFGVGITNVEGFLEGNDWSF